MKESLEFRIIRSLGMFAAFFVIPFKRNVPLEEVLSFRGYQNHIILTKRKWCLTNLFIKGKYKHAGIINGNQTTVVEATTRGTVETPIREFLSTKHSYAIARPIGYTQHEKDVVEHLMYDYIGSVYDWLFKFGTKRIYCSELITIIFNIARPNLFKQIGRVIGPSELLDSGIEIVHTFEV